VRGNEPLLDYFFPEYRLRIKLVSSTFRALEWLGWHFPLCFFRRGYVRPRSALHKIK